MNININTLIGFKIKTIDGTYGVVSDFLFTDEDHVIRYLVVDPQKWNPLSQKLLVSPVSVYYVNLDAKEVCLSIDTEKLLQSPDIEEQETVSRHFETELYRYYGYGYYWMGTDLWGMSSDPSLLQATIAKEGAADNRTEQEIHLRSTNEVFSYLAQSSDEHSLQLSDFVFNTKSWLISFAVIDCHTGMLSKERSLIKIAAIKQYNWHEQSVSLSLHSEQIKGNPHFEPKLLNSEKFLAMMDVSPTTPDFGG